MKFTYFERRDKLGDTDSKVEEIEKELELVIENNRQESENTIFLVVDGIFYFKFRCRLSIKPHFSLFFRIFIREAFDKRLALNFFFFFF